MEQDFLDEMIEESTKMNPDFPTLMEEARQRRILHKDFREANQPTSAAPTNADDSKKYLQMLGAELQKLHITGEILLAGNEMLLLDIKQPEQHVDIDTYLGEGRSGFDLPVALDSYFGRDGKILRETIVALTKRESLPENWMYIALQSLFFSESSQIQWIEYPGLRIYCSSLDYLLAVKVATGYPQDVVDIRRLAEALQIASSSDMLVVITRYIPEQLLTHEMHLLINQIFGIS